MKCIPLAPLLKGHQVQKSDKQNQGNVQLKTGDKYCGELLTLMSLGWLF